MQRPNGVPASLDGGIVNPHELHLDVRRGRADGRQVRECVCVRGGRGGTARGCGCGEGLEVERVSGEHGAGNEGVRVGVDYRNRECDASGRQVLRLEGA